MLKTLTFMSILLEIVSCKQYIGISNISIYELKI